MISLQQAKLLTPGVVLYHSANRNFSGTPQRWRVSGKPRTWKRDPGRVEVPMKHGLYHHDHLTASWLHTVSFTEEEAHMCSDGTKGGLLASVSLVANLLYCQHVVDDCTYADVVRGQCVVQRMADSWGFTFQDLWQAMGRGLEQTGDHDVALATLAQYKPDTPRYILVDALQDAGLSVPVVNALLAERTMC